jgi:hypothetical protein
MQVVKIKITNDINLLCIFFPFRYLFGAESDRSAPACVMRLAEDKASDFMRLSVLGGWIFKKKNRVGGAAEAPLLRWVLRPR